MNPSYMAAVRDAVEQTSRKAVAEQIGIDPSDLGKYLSGAKTPSLPTQAKITAFVDGRTAAPAPANPADEPSDKIKQVNAAKREKKALDKWVKDGRKGDKPATPNLDAIGADHVAKTNGAKKTSARKSAEPKRRPVAPGIRFYHGKVGDDATKPMPDSQNKLSSVAYYFTKGIDGKPRLSTDALIALLKSKGVENPTTEAWDVELPNGVRLRATV